MVSSKVTMETNHLGDRNGEGRRKRILTDARREQNRIAQRSYRRRQKENVRKASGDLRPLQPSTKKESARLEAAIESGPPEQSIANLDIHDRIQQRDCFQPLGDFDLTQQLEFMQGENPWLNAAQFSSSPIAPGPDSSIMNILPTNLGSIPSRSSGISQLEWNPPSGAPLFSTDSVHSLVPDDGLLTLGNAHPSVTGSSAIETDLEAQHGELGNSSMALSLTFSPTSQASLFYPRTTSGLSEHNNIQAPPDLSASSHTIYGQAENTMTSPRLPSVQNIWFPQPGILTASLYNALILGITLPSLLTPRLLSPFYRPSTLPSESPATLIAKASNPAFPPHLQPTLPQILFPHHAFLDLLPFPVLRARAITLGATSPRLFDPMDLKKDIIKDGLVCRRLGEGDAKGDGQPWDGRTWDIAPWFLKKWQMLLVGEEGSFES